MKKYSKIFIAGHRGLVGSAILEILKNKGYENLVFKTHSELDLTNQKAVADFFEKEKPEYVFLSAAKVGGILANDTYRADFIYENLMIQNNVIYHSFLNNVKKLLFLGSTCIYPKNSPQPMCENALLSSELEYTNEPYAIAKIAGLKMCESYNLQYNTNFISVMPTNLYGINDNFDLYSSHVLPALIRKMHLAKLLQNNNEEEILTDLKLDDFSKAREYLKNFGVFSDKVEIWGSGKPRREFLFVEDMADACVFIMENINFKDLYNENDKEIRNTHINIGTGSDIAIKDLALMIKDIVGFQGDLIFNAQKPDGTMVKLSDVSKLEKLGWKYKTQLQDGIKKVYDGYLKKGMK
ncbi:GDP-L-fucose synthase [Campylobacter jejuni]|uniref:GDP-L-fucose synthase family protein n=1 Tax=Campylobacter jejuni TaxID=197 RepID=UPI0012C089EE|nr:GDP-L-fucose synthase [Campylobacter jejuni]EAK5278018.1 GDP-L-fucose synthase [Campylobacter jejuni]EAL5082346.1 GDP-L-fucose synthase [Campylobacter jejuni]EDP5872805.1 GDP-L-fucose synthase [Campylobacter jejuni]MBX2083207.1 GDP-L-fucose synthase [Campylobacter jejuni]MCH3877103.1 GDP-L-fucose synthase [Campylobacter jejuni]